MGRYLAYAFTVTACYAGVRPYPAHYTSISDVWGWDHWMHFINAITGDAWIILAVLNALCVVYVMYQKEEIAP